VLHQGSSRTTRFGVLTADHVPLALENPLNRVLATVARPGVASAKTNSDGASTTLTGVSAGRTFLTLTYQRQLASGTYRDVHQGPNGLRPVSVRIPVIVRP
jgi:hypothetical protein